MRLDGRTAEMIRRAPGSTRQLARAFGVSPMTVSSIKRGVTWIGRGGTRTSVVRAEGSRVTLRFTPYGFRRKVEVTAPALVIERLGEARLKRMIKDHILSTGSDGSSFRVSATLRVTACRP